MRTAAAAAAVAAVTAPVNIALDTIYIITCMHTQTSGAHFSHLAVHVLFIGSLTV